MPKITPAILAAAMLAGGNVHAQQPVPPHGGGTSAGVRTPNSTGVNSGTAEGEGRLAGRTEILIPGKDREEPVGGAASVTTREGAAKKEDSRKRSISGTASSSVEAGTRTR